MGTDLRTAAQQALEVLIRASSYYDTYAEIDALRAALEQPERAQAMRDAGYTRKPTLREMAEPEQPEQEPAAWQERQAKRMKDGVVTEWSSWYPCRYRTIDEAKAEACDHIQYEWRPLFTHPHRREWRGLTEEEIEAKNELRLTRLQFAHAIEAALKENNHE